MRKKITKRKLKLYADGGMMGSAGMSMGDPYMMAAQAGGAVMKGAAPIPRQLAEQGLTPQEINEKWSMNPYLDAELSGLENQMDIAGSAMSMDVSGIMKGVGNAITDYNDISGKISNTSGLSGMEKTYLRADQLLNTIPGTGILGQAYRGIGRVFGGGDIQDKFKKTQAQEYKQNRFAASRTNTPITLNALGGKLSNAQTMDQFNPDMALNTYENGGSHSQNTNGGIPQGMSTDGSLNTVEEGESRVGDYIFSNRLKLKNPELVNLGSKLKNKTFSDVSKKLYKEVEERPNDSISKRTWKANIGKLIAANEYAKMNELDSNEFGCGGKIK